MIHVYLKNIANNGTLIICKKKKDVQEVVNVVYNAGLSKLVVHLKPVIVVKG